MVIRSKLLSLTRQPSVVFFCNLVIGLVCLSMAQAQGISTSVKSNDKKVFAHYLGWYADSSSSNGLDTLRHWRCGYAHTPTIGLYDSRRPSVLTYQILTAWACGIDGFVYNWYGKESFENSSLNILKTTIEMIRTIDTTFRFSFAVSYDDQIVLDTDTIVDDFIYLRDSIITSENYLKQEGNRPVIFIFNYDSTDTNNNKWYGHVSDYRIKGDSIFEPDPFIAWNECNAIVSDTVNVYYPWVQPSGTGWDPAGGNWGKDYLLYFYNRINQPPFPGRCSLACGGVWPGFDDRSNTCWGQNRWMDRKGTVVYDSTWILVHNYSGALPMNWVYIETWNDWNEGTEIEPSIEYGYKHLVATINNINQFKSASISSDTMKFIAADSIYVASMLIETGVRDSATYYPKLKRAIAQYLKDNYDTARIIADTIIAVVGESEYRGQLFPAAYDLQQNYPNPVNFQTTFKYQLPQSCVVRLSIYNVAGQLVKQFDMGRQQPGYYNIKWNANKAANGVYIYELNAGDFRAVKKMMVLK